MEEINILDFINQQLDYLNGTDGNIGLIQNQEDQITRYLNGRDESSLSREERQVLRSMRTELNRRTDRRDELEKLYNRYDELSGASSFGQTFEKIDTINKVFAERKQRRLGRYVTVSTAEPDVRYVETVTRVANVDLSKTIGDDIKRTKSVEASVTVGARNPVGRVKGDGLEIMKNIISLQAIIDFENTHEEGVASQEQISTAKSLLEKMMKIAKKEYDYSEKMEELSNIIELNGNNDTKSKQNENPGEAAIAPDEIPNEPDEELGNTPDRNEENEFNSNDLKWQSGYIDKFEEYTKSADSFRNKYNGLTSEEKRLLMENELFDINQKIYEKIEEKFKLLRDKLQIDDESKTKIDVLGYLAKLDLNEINEQFGGTETMELGSDILDELNRMYENYEEIFNQIIEKRRENSISEGRENSTSGEIPSAENNDNTEKDGSEGANGQEESEKDSENSKSSNNKSKNVTENVKIGLIGSILVTILKFLKFITQKIKPLNSFFSGIEDSLYEAAKTPLLNSGDLKDKANGLFTKLKENSKETLDVDQFSENIKYVFENRKDEVFKDLYQKEGDILRKEYKGLHSQKAQKKVMRLMINEDVPKVMDDNADTVISYKTLKAFVEKAKSEGIVPQSADIRDIDIKELCEKINQKNATEEIKNNREYMSAIKDIVLEKSEFNPIRDVFVEEMEKVSQELDALSPSERMKRISKLIKDENVAILVEGKNYTNIALMRTFNKVEHEIREYFPDIPDLDLKELKRDFIWSRAWKANIRVFDEDDNAVDQNILIEKLKEYQENIRKSDRVARDFQEHNDDQKTAEDNDQNRESSK